jgi:methylamine dehydrogenase accessory protein MauD
MGPGWLVSQIASWLALLSLGLLLLGALRNVATLSWRLDQLEATTPSKINRNGLKPGVKAPEFTLPDTDGNQVSLQAFAGRKVLLTFTQSGCRPCQAVMPALAKLQKSGEIQVVVVNNGGGSSTRDWARQQGVTIPVLVQERYELSKRYEAYATPFAFVIDERGVVVSRGLVSSARQISFVLSAAEEHTNQVNSDRSVQVRRRVQPA